MEAPPRSQEATCCGKESLFCKWIFPRVQAMTIRSGQITSRYSLQLIKHSSHYLRSQTTRDQDLDQGLGSAQGWNGRALETAALSLSLPATVEQLLKLNYVYLMFWFTHKLATSECRRLTLPGPAPPRPESTTHATEPEARSRTKSEQYVRAEQADADAQTFSLPVKLVAARAGAHSTNTDDARSHTHRASWL